MTEDQNIDALSFKENSESTYEVRIYCGRRVGYDGDVIPMYEVERICDEYVNRVKLCVTITETRFHYVGGSEPGVIVGLINYPRFPQPVDEIASHAFKLAKRLLVGLKQYRLSIVMPTMTTVLTNPLLEEKKHAV